MSYVNEIFSQPDWCTQTHMWYLSAIWEFSAFWWLTAFLRWKPKPCTLISLEKTVYVISAHLCLKTQCVITSPSLAHFIPLAGLQDNPWVCDCRLSTLLDISKAPESSLVLLDRFLTCSEPPDLAGVPFQSVELTRCRRPYVVTSATKITALLGSNVLLRCDATGYPTPTIMWIKSARSNLYNQGIFLYIVMLIKYESNKKIGNTLQ